MFKYQLDTVVELLEEFIEAKIKDIQSEQVEDRMYLHFKRNELLALLTTLVEIKD